MPRSADAALELGYGSDPRIRLLSGGGLVGLHGGTVPDDSLYVILDPMPEARDLRLPATHLGERWAAVLDTAAIDPFAADEATHLEAGELRSVAAHSVVVLRGAG